MAQQNERTVKDPHGTPAAPGATGQPDSTEPGKEEVNDAAAKLNEISHIFDRALHFEVAEEGPVLVKVLDTVTGEVIREIPPESLVKAMKDIQSALGLFMDRKV